MTTNAVSVDGIWKNFRMYHEKNQYLKAALLRGRRARFDEFWALDDVTFDIPFGSTFGIIGSNGSGKSTLLKCMAGILSPDKGTITVNGRVAPLLELGAGFHYELSGRENVFLNGAILGMTNKETTQKFDDIVDFAGIGKFIDTPVKNYSSGMIVRLGFAVATNVDPEILIIDEVLAVGDQAFQRRCHERIETLRQEGRTIILVSHGLSDVQRLCDSVAWLEKGKVRLLGDAYEVCNEYEGVSNNAQPSLEGDIGKRWGSGEIEIMSVEITDSSGKTPDTFKTGSPLFLRLNYDAHKLIDNVVAQVRISHLHGIDIWATSSKHESPPMPPLHGIGHIDLRIDELPLLEGTYDLSIALTDYTEVREYDHWEKRTRFDVHQDDLYDAGLITMKSRWTIPTS